MIKKADILAFLFVILSLCMVAAGRIIYVDASAPGLNNGSSWANAYKYLQDALTDASSALKPVEIRVAEGIYTPDSNSANPNGGGDRKATFQLISGVALKGGHAGFGQPDPNARDNELFETVLSGDLNGNDVDIEPNEPGDLVWDPTRSENSYHVLVADGVNSSAILDGFTVAHGNANMNGLPPHHWGGGMYNTSGSPTLNNCKFEENVSRGDGAGIHNDNGSPVITDCMFIRNTGQHWGGGMFNVSGSPMMFNCTFGDNLAQFGGGTFNKASSVKYSDCLFKQNSVTFYGGGLYNLDGNSTLTNCEFLYNQTPWYGGGLFNNSGNLILTNCTVADNVSDFQGGGIYDLEGQRLRLDNCIFWGNNALEGPQIADNEPNTTVVSFSDVQGGWQGEGSGNIDVDPCFADSNNSDFHVKSQAGRWDPNTESWIRDAITSPCINAGDPLSPLGSEPFPNGGIVNMGAYGGTEEASKSYFGKPPCETIVAGDLNGDCVINFLDFRLMALHWCEDNNP
jgi:hypothetical protein